MCSYYCMGWWWLRSLASLNYYTHGSGWKHQPHGMIELGDKFLEKATTKLHLYLITMYYYYKELYSHTCLAKNRNIFVS